MKHTLLLSSLVLLLAGCRTPGHVREGEPAQISVGMTKEEVLRKIGKPETVVTEGDAEIFGYTLERPWWQTSRFRVRLENGKVHSSEIVDR